MSCPKNIIWKTLFWTKWKSEGEHDMSIYSIGKFMDCSEHFQVIKVCSICGIQKKESFVETEDLLRLGFSIDELNKVSRWHSIYPNLNQPPKQ